MTLLQLLNLETGASYETLQRIIATAPKRYKTYPIKKRSGGVRIIAHPAKELKILQRVILHSILYSGGISPIATAYVENRGIKFNAEAHSKAKWLLKLDFESFFHSITPSDWDRALRQNESFLHYYKDNALLRRLIFWGAGSPEPSCLSIGAPTSPTISNLVCLRLDTWMMANADKYNLTVTRYADDITVSGENVKDLLRFEKALEGALSRNAGLNLRLNYKKRGLYGPGERKMVTGLIITPDHKISIGRERKRQISAMIHKYIIGDLDSEDIMKIKGLLSFAMSVERDFFNAMMSKYGKEHILRLLQENFTFYESISNFD